MKPLDWVAAFGLFILLPIPVYWLLVHPFAGFWRRAGMRPAFLTSGLTAWSAGGIFVFYYRDRLFASALAPAWVMGTGFFLIAAAFFVFRRVMQELGAPRLVGKTELSGGGELRTTGLYARLRHPSYAAQMSTMLGLCLAAGTPLLWAVAGVWWLLLLMAIGFEERELRARFGAAYEDYRHRVPAFLPLRFR